MTPVEPVRRDNMNSESDLEIVHDDGTVTDKRDGIRRAYDDHVAHILGPSPFSNAVDGAPAPPGVNEASVIHSKVLRAGAIVAGAGAVASVLVHFTRW